MGRLILMALVGTVLYSGAVQAQDLPNYAQLEAESGTGFLGEKEDGVDLGTAKVYFTAPKGWLKEANVHANNGQTFYFLKYRPADKDNTTFILVTGLKAKDTDVVASAQRSVDSFRKKMPAERFTDAKPVKVKRTGAAYFERTSADGRSFWARYQFLVAERALKVQLMANQGVNKKDLVVLEKLARSIRIEQINDK